MMIATGIVAAPVSRLAVISAQTPTLTPATAKAPAPIIQGISTMPRSPLAATATISGAAVVDADKRRVLRPDTVGKPGLFAHEAVMARSIGLNAAEALNEITNV